MVSAAPQAPAPPRTEAIRELLTVLITTSPTHSNPSTGLIEMVTSSFRLVDGLGSAQLVVVCDGASLQEANNFRRGVMRPEHAAKYEEYKSRLRVLAAGGGDAGSVLAGARVVELEGRHGFAHAVRRGLEAVATPYVMVVQHDRNFRHGFDLPGVLAAMEAHPGDCHYVGMPSATQTNDYAHFVASKYRGLRVGRRVAGGVALLQMVQFVDSTHVGRCSWYRDFVFRAGGHFVTPTGRPKRSMFIEDRLGQDMLADLRAHGMAEAHGRWGVWLLDAEAIVQHCDAHDLRVLEPGARMRYAEEPGRREAEGGAGARGGGDRGPE